VALEGSLAPLACLEEGSTPLEEDTGLRYVWQRMRAAVEPVLRSITVAELVERQRIHEARLVWTI
jgi:DNA-binding IscR family transcriptional regulator